MVENDAFPSIAALAAMIGPLDPATRERVESWLSLSPELQAMVPHVAQLIADGMGGDRYWASLSDAGRNIMEYTAAALLAEARRRAAHDMSNLVAQATYCAQL